METALKNVMGIGVHLILTENDELIHRVPSNARI
jgi:hypothetical protein